MNRQAFWCVFGAAAFATVACSIVMAFLVDHHWYITYQIALLFERTMWWVQFTGLVLSPIAVVGISRNLTRRLKSRLGIASMFVGLLLVPFALNIHEWTIALFLPALFSLLDGSLLVLVPSRKNEEPASSQHEK